MKPFENLEVWFVTGSQNLYGQRILDQVEANSKHIVANLMESVHIPINVVYQPTVKSPEDVLHMCRRANNHSFCVGLKFTVAQLGL